MEFEHDQHHHGDQPEHLPTEQARHPVISPIVGTSHAEAQIIQPGPDVAYQQSSHTEDSKSEHHESSEHHKTVEH